MRLSRKLKKRIIKVFGRGTYFGIVKEYLTLEKYSNNGVLVVYTNKIITDSFFNAGQFNPYLNFKKIYKK